MIRINAKFLVCTTLFLLCASISSVAEKAKAEKPVYYVYLAGPEVFLSDPIKAGEDKKALIQNLNESEAWPFTLIGLYPMDNEIPDFKANSETGMRIYHANLELMNKADFIAANMVRFRGPSMDVGTAFEMGYMAGAGKPVFAYYDAVPFYGAAEEANLYNNRVKEHWGLSETDASLDKDGIHIENFAMTDNLMMVGSHIDTGYSVSEDFEKAIFNIADYLINKK